MKQLLTSTQFKAERRSEEHSRSGHWRSVVDNSLWKSIQSPCHTRALGENQVNVTELMPLVPSRKRCKVRRLK